MRTTNRRPIATSLLLVGATLLLTGCGDEGNHLPAGMTGAGSAYMTPAGGDILGSDPGPLAPGVASGLEDPVLAGHDGLEEIDSLASDDPFSRASQDWSETEGSLSTMGSSALDDLGLDDGPMPVGYGGGYGRGYDDGWGVGGIGGYGGGVLSSAGYGGGWGGSAGLMDAGMIDAGMGDLGFDAGLEDPGFVDGGFDAGFVDAGMDAGFVDAGFDAGVDPGFTDPGFVDAGMADVGIDPGFADVGAVDVGGFDAGLAVY